jgi:SHAQKYF class myb-like DNA-binding protein
MNTTFKTGRWSPSEHKLFIDGLKKYGKKWKKIKKLIPTRTLLQVRSHAQKFFLRMKEFKNVKNLNGKYLNPKKVCDEYGNPKLNGTRMYIKQNDKNKSQRCYQQQMQQDQMQFMMQPIMQQPQMYYLQHIDYQQNMHYLRHMHYQRYMHYLRHMHYLRYMHYPRHMHYQRQLMYYSNRYY